jgi:TRAP-type C4-dicarboxylate transport system permease small subunit
MSENADLAAIESGGPSNAAGAFGGFVSVVAAIGTVWTFLLMFLIVADVIGRSFLSMPITGVAEIAAHSIVAIVFLQLAAAIHAKRMTRADFLVERVAKASPRAGAVAEAAFLLFGAASLALIAWAGWKPAMSAYTGREFFGVQGLFTIPTWPVRAIIVFGSALGSLVFLVQVVAELKKFSTGRAD